MSDREDARAKVRALLREDGRTYADEAGIRLADKPAPLFELLLLALLLSTRISTDIALEASRQLRQAGWRTPEKLLESTWQQRVDVLGRAHYRRYDESTATALGKAAQLVKDRWHGDLRRLRDEAGGDPERVRELVQETPRIGPIGADVFCREAQGVWPQLRPWLDERALRGARECGLPTDTRRLASLVPADQLPNLAASLVRVTL
jgi:hypothetical protein